MTGSWATDEHARATMVANRSKDTSPELAVRSLLHAQGLRYRTHHRPEPTLRRTADILFTRRRVAVFIDGCFWHACPEHFIAPRSNPDYWGPKIASNQRRDRETDSTLASLGWAVLRFWEHERPADVAGIIERVVYSQPNR
ncbi:very short patch repair endonuclease [Microbacterium sp. 4-7]|uniref:very short patch repair endonuclease n=1 Tax=Microbacterium sp. 4-7 TaxID=1885327 RepID=UPI0016505A34|nr:very short patch repair endonuclease [Microbacterium sp. 4-7]MBC6493550.1 very short patch repair endonuclease [Microbacterium sp. 4-7]